MTSKPLLFQNDYLTTVELCAANAPYENLQKGELLSLNIIFYA